MFLFWLNKVCVVFSRLDLVLIRLVLKCLDSVWITPVAVLGNACLYFVLQKQMVLVVL